MESRKARWRGIRALGVSIGEEILSSQRESWSVPGETLSCDLVSPVSRRLTRWPRAFPENAYRCTVDRNSCLQPAPGWVPVAVTRSNHVPWVAAASSHLACLGRIHPVDTSCLRGLSDAYRVSSDAYVPGPTVSPRLWLRLDWSGLSVLPHRPYGL